MDKVKIYKDGQYMDESLNSVQGNNIVQIIKTESLEINIYNIPKGIVGGFAPKIHGYDLEVYYIVSGSLTLHLPDGKANIIDTGDFISFSESDLYYPFQIEEDVTIMMILTNHQFDITKDTYTNLSNILSDLQAQDGDTLEHCQRVCRLSVALAIETRYDFSKLKDLFYAAKFHDVGKAKIPLELIIKPSKLTKEEYDIMKSHVVYSSDMVEPYFGSEIARIIIEHHEHLDGSGYPMGLTAKDIHPASKIIAVADGYDALVTTRPYHKGVSQQEAIKELKRCPGQFDQDIVNALINYLQKRQ